MHLFKILCILSYVPWESIKVYLPLTLTVLHIFKLVLTLEVGS